MRSRIDIPFSELTTLRLGGPAERLVEVDTDEELMEAVRSEREPLLVIAGGSNLVVSDEGFAGTVLRIATRGITVEGAHVEVAAGEPWDGVVARCGEEQLAGIECLSGIPGSVGATPIQNVGAYGQDVSMTISSVRVYDRDRGTVATLSPAQCGFGYRTSALKRSHRHVVLSVGFELERSPLARPLRYAELARKLGASPGDRPPLGALREAVLELRRNKGMVIDPGDPDSVSAGSFFVNPIVAPEVLEPVTERAGARPPAWPEPDGRVKTSAAWLIERAGFGRGYGDGRVAVSNKHTLALINRGGATTAELLELARELRDGVLERFGIELQAEPTLVGVAL